MGRAYLARFAYKRTEVKQARVHWRLFDPPKNGKLSLYFIDGLSDSEIAQLGKDKGQNR